MFVALDFFPGRPLSAHDDYGLTLLSAMARVPECATVGSAAYDCFADLHERVVTFRNAMNREYTLPALQTFPGQPESDWRITLQPGHRAKVPLGIAMKMPVGFVAKLYIRSGDSWKQNLRLVNGTGLIDSDYPDEWMAMVENNSADVVEIVSGQKVCQVAFSEYRKVSGLRQRETQRTGGFGSTGTK